MGGRETYIVKGRQALGKYLCNLLLQVLLLLNIVEEAINLSNASAQQTKKIQLAVFEFDPGKSRAAGNTECKEHSSVSARCYTRREARAIAQR